MAFKVFVDPDTGEERGMSVACDGDYPNGEKKTWYDLTVLGVLAEMKEYVRRLIPPVSDMAFPRAQLYQFIQPNTLAIIESMYPEAVETAYQNALAYVQSYVGAMFDIDAMLESGDTSSSAMTLRLALCISTVTFILASSPQYAETIQFHNENLSRLLKGLKSGSRNFGKAAIEGDPNVRVQIVKLKKTGARS